jgi:tetratricopeptide (TPR) repeat protein
MAANQLLSVFFCVLILNACTQKEEQKICIRGLTGIAYPIPVLPPATQAKLDSNLQVAVENFKAAPSEDTYIWLGRRLAYLYRYDSAIAIFTEALGKYPDSFRLLRHRGHRYITIREFDKAIEDLTRAAELMKGAPLEIEPDGQPNKLNIPLSTTQFNVWYHLGLAHYLKGEYEMALEAYRECMTVCENDDSVIATADWLYMTLRKLEREDEAKLLLASLKKNPTIIENDSYLKRIALYKGELAPEDILNVSDSAEDRDLTLATQGYGVGNWYLYEGDSARAYEIFEQVISGKNFAAFGFIAAEAELARKN